MEIIKTSRTNAPAATPYTQVFSFPSAQRSTQHTLTINTLLHIVRRKEELWVIHINIGWKSDTFLRHTSMVRKYQLVTESLMENIEPLTPVYSTEWKKEFSLKCVTATNPFFCLMSSTFLFCLLLFPVPAYTACSFFPFFLYSCFFLPLLPTFKIHQLSRISRTHGNHVLPFSLFSLLMFCCLVPFLAFLNSQIMLFFLCHCSSVSPSIPPSSFYFKGFLLMCPYPFIPLLAIMSCIYPMWIQ